MRRFAPLLPAWAIGLWRLLTSDELWDEQTLEHTLKHALDPDHHSAGHAGWTLLGALVLASVLYARANSLGRKLLVSSNSSLMLSIDEPNRLQATSGANVVRALVLLGLYVLVVAL